MPDTSHLQSVAVTTTTGGWLIVSRPDFMQMIASPDTPRMRRVAYVAPRGAAVWTTPANTGWAALPDVMVARPDGAQWAVVEVLDFERLSAFCLIDLYDLRVSPDQQVLSLGWHKKFSDLDAAIMAASMTIRERT